ncbi:MAG: VOC family protein, partial [Deltaproteobacteria bacterium]|nr:VOC family protein [Deltaproteobacteria bacterium]
MDLVSIRLITADVARLVAFYEAVTGLAARWLAPVFAEIPAPSCT